MNSSPTERLILQPGAGDPSGESRADRSRGSGAGRPATALRRAQVWRRHLALAALVLAVGAAPLATRADQPPAELTAEPGISYEPATRRLRVDVLDEPLTEVLDTIAGETDISLVIRGAGYGSITAHFELPLEQGLTELLEGQGHVLVWDRDRAQVRKILLLSPTDGASQARAGTRTVTAGRGPSGETFEIDAAAIEAELAEAIELSKELDDSQVLLRDSLNDLGTLTQPDALKELKVLLDLEDGQDLPPDMQTLLEALDRGQLQD